jgi:hypothetical protein
VLIQTWNTEGFAPLDEEDTLVQLAYVACVMTEMGEQWIARKRLLELLRQARRELDELQYTVLTPEAFLERIEYRSGLLTQTGNIRFDGELQSVYQFRHLVFQEYLTSLGLVNGWHPDRKERSLVELMEAHFDDERWTEIVPLAVMLAPRRSEPVLQRLIQRSIESANALAPFDTRAFILRQCLLDEAQIGLDTLRAALQCTAGISSARSVAGREIRTAPRGDHRCDAVAGPSQSSALATSARYSLSERSIALLLLVALRRRLNRLGGTIGDHRFDRVGRRGSESHRLTGSQAHRTSMRLCDSETMNLPPPRRLEDLKT